MYIFRIQLVDSSLIEEEWKKINQNRLKRKTKKDLQYTEGRFQRGTFPELLSKERKDSVDHF